MTKLEEEFTGALLEQLRLAEEATGVPEPRLRAQAEKLGGPAAMREMLRRGQTTRQFIPLQKIHKLSLSPEYLLTMGKYASLFTDEEADLCLAALVDAGAFML